MTRSVAPFVLATLVLAVPPLAEGAPRSAPTRARADVAARSGDLLPPATQLRLTRGKRVATTAAGAVAVEDVGDADSFGRPLKWLGVTNAFLTLAASCDPAEPTPCRVLSPSPASTSFNVPDAVRIRLPAKASNSLLCYWFSPVLTVNYQNATAAPVIARLVLNPTLTVESPVLADPALIDPSTGAPFGGRLETGMTSAERFEVPLPAGVSFSERTRDSAVCIAGFLTRRNLIDGYGLTPAQADEVFKQPMTIRLNLRGSAQHVGHASMVFGLRIIGD